MLPHAYQLPAAIVLVVSGALTCFAGYRFFRLVLAIFGFIIGAAAASSLMAPSNTPGMLIGALVGGLIGAAVLVLAYFVGIALVGAALGALVTHAVWSIVGTGDPPWVVVIVVAVIGAIGAMVLQRYVIIVATAFGGAWTLLVGGLAIAGNRAAAATAEKAASSDVWILYPFTPAPGQRGVLAAWIVLGLIGTAVQLGLTAKRR